MSTTTYQAKPVLDLKMQLGEGPFWDTHRQRLFFVDINARRLHYYNPGSKQHGFHQLNRMPTALAMQKDYSLLVALEDRLDCFVPETGQISPQWEAPIKSKEVRTNDGRVGPDGRYYIGTIDREHKRPVAALYRVEPDGSFHLLLSDRTISNGIAWSLDHQTMYYIDSPTHSVQAYDFDETTGNITHERTLVETDQDEGVPDGMTIDGAGHLWVAHHGAGYVARYHGRTGKLMAKVEVSAPNVSSCTFGGADYQTLYITTAREGLSDEQLEQYPLSGGLFAIELPQPGSASFSFG